MYKTILIGFVILLVCSCTDNQKIWLQDYKNTKCNLAETKADFIRDSIVNSAKYFDRLAEIQTEIKKIEAPIHSEIELLNSKIGQINIKYLKKSRKISEEQERSNGHNSTPEYESKMNQNNKNNNHEVLALENKKKFLQLELDENKILHELFVKQNKIQQQIASTTSILKEKYKTTFDSLKNKLNNQNSDFRMILEDLDIAEKENFKEKRKKINTNPCK